MDAHTPAFALSAREVEGPSSGGFKKLSTPLVSRRAPSSVTVSPVAGSTVGGSSVCLSGGAVSSTSPARPQISPFGAGKGMSVESSVEKGPAANTELLEVEAELRELEARLGVKIPDSPPSTELSPCTERAKVADGLGPASVAEIPTVAGMAKFTAQRPPPITSPPSTVGDSDGGSSVCATSGTNASRSVTQTRQGTVLEGVEENDATQSGSPASGVDGELDLGEHDASVGVTVGATADLLAQMEADMRLLEAGGVLAPSATEVSGAGAGHISPQVGLLTESQANGDTVGLAFTSIFGDRASSFGAFQPLADTEEEAAAARAEEAAMAEEAALVKAEEAANAQGAADAEKAAKAAEAAAIAEEAAKAAEAEEASRAAADAEEAAILAALEAEEAALVAQAEEAANFAKAANAFQAEEASRAAADAEELAARVAEEAAQAEEAAKITEAANFANAAKAFKAEEEASRATADAEDAATRVAEEAAKAEEAAEAEEAAARAAEEVAKAEEAAKARDLARQVARQTAEENCKTRLPELQRAAKEAEKEAEEAARVAEEAANAEEIANEAVRKLEEAAKIAEDVAQAEEARKAEDAIKEAELAEEAYEAMIEKQAEDALQAEAVREAELAAIAADDAAHDAAQAEEARKNEEAELAKQARKAAMIARQAQIEDALKEAEMAEKACQAAAKQTQDALQAEAVREAELAAKASDDAAKAEMARKNENSVREAELAKQARKAAMIARRAQMEDAMREAEMAEQAFEAAQQSGDALLVGVVREVEEPANDTEEAMRIEEVVKIEGVIEAVELAEEAFEASMGEEEDAASPPPPWVRRQMEAEKAAEEAAQVEEAREANLLAMAAAEDLKAEEAAEEAARIAEAEEDAEAAEESARIAEARRRLAQKAAKAANEAAQAEEAARISEAEEDADAAEEAARIAEARRRLAQKAAKAAEEAAQAEEAARISEAEEDADAAEEAARIAEARRRLAQKAAKAAEEAAQAEAAWQAEEEAEEEEPTSDDEGGACAGFLAFEEAMQAQAEVAAPEADMFEGVEEARQAPEDSKAGEEGQDGSDADCEFMSWSKVAEEVAAMEVAEKAPLGEDATKADAATEEANADVSQVEPHPDADAALTVGMYVLIGGLIGAVELNGREAVVTGRNAYTGRLIVELEGGGGQKSLKQENLTVIRQNGSHFVEPIESKPNNEIAELEAELREMEDKLPSLPAEGGDKLQDAEVDQAVDQFEQMMEMQQKILDENDEKDAAEGPHADVAVKEHWSVALARQRDEAGMDDEWEKAGLPEAKAAQAAAPSLTDFMQLSDATSQALAGERQSPCAPRQEQPGSFLNQVFTNDVTEITSPAKEFFETAPCFGVQKKVALASPAHPRLAKQRPPELHGALFSEPEASPTPSVPSAVAAAGSSRTPAAANGNEAQGTEIETDDPVLLGHGLYGNISTLAQEQYQEEVRIKKQKELEKQDRKLRKKREEAQKRQERLEKLGIPPRAPPLLGLGRPAPVPNKLPRPGLSSDLPRLAPIRESSLPRIPAQAPRPSKSMPALARKESPSERVFQGVPLPPVIPMRRAAPGTRLPAVPEARLAGSASAPSLSGPSLESIERQKMRLASKMEVFQAAQQQLNNVGNLSADELRNLLKSLNADPVSPGSCGDDRVVRRRMKQVDKFCKAMG